MYFRVILCFIGFLHTDLLVVKNMNPCRCTMLRHTIPHPVAKQTDAPANEDAEAKTFPGFKPVLLLVSCFRTPDVCQHVCDLFTKRNMLFFHLEEPRSSFSWQAI